MNAQATTLRRPGIVDPWASESTSASPVQAGALKRERPAIVDPWSAAGQDSVPATDNAQPKSATPSLFRTAGDLARLGGGGIVTGTGRAIEGIERGVADSFREAKPGRVRFLDESGRPAPMTESQRERLRAWAARNPAYEPSRVSQSLKRTGESIQEGVSPSMKQAMEGTELGGDILSPSTWTLGKDPSARGLLGHITKVGGEMAPVVAAGAIPVVGPGAAVAAATGQSYSGAYEESRDFVLNAPADELEKSPRYRKLLAGGLSEGAARKVLADEAGRGAAGIAAPIGGVSGAILGGVATKPLQNAIARRAGNTFGARLMGNLAEMPLEGLQEVAESVGGRYGANQAAGLDRDLTEGTFADFALGAAAAGPAAVVHSASSGTPRGDRDSDLTAQHRAELIASDTPPAAAPLALPPPGAITVDSEGNATTPAQARERESLGLTPDVRRAQAQQEARQAVTFPDAAPGSLADAANALPQGAPALADGAPLPDPAAGPLSRAVIDGAADGTIPPGFRSQGQMLANLALDAEEARQRAQREREMGAILRESRLPAALYDAEVARAAGVDEVARAPTAMELAMQRARSEAEAKSTRAAIVDPWAAPNTPESLGANLRFAENSTSYAPGDQSYAPQDPSLDPALITQSPDSITPVRFEPLGANGLLVYGDAAEIRARLAEVGFPKKGRNRDGALRFDAADRQALEAALMHGVDPARVPQGQARAEGSVGIPADVGSVQSITPNIAPAQAPAVGRLAAPITPPWMNSATEETSTPTTEQIRAAVEQQVAAQHRHNGSTGVNSAVLSRAWGVPQKDVSRIARQVRANFDPARVESAPPAVEPARAAGRTQPRPAIRDPFAAPQDTVDGSTAPSSTSASTATVATHADPGQPSEPATPAVIADSAATVARAPNVTMPQAKREVFSQIDAALAKANTDAWPDMPEGSSMAARGRRQAAEDERERITRTAGYVTFDVPGDGTFRVVNNRARLEAFRAQVEKQFKMPQPPRGPQPARIAMSDAERAKVMAEAETVDDDAPSFSRTGGTQGQASGNGLPVDNVKRIARDFMRQYRGNIPLEVKVGRTLEELYGLNAGGLGAAKGAYHPKSRVLTLAADRLSSRADVEATLRHEALGHFGLNTLSPDDKRAVLDAILTSRNQRSLASVWAQVDALYADMPESVRAEEVFAELASRERGTLGEWWDRILALLARGLRNVGLLRGDTSKAELHDLARRIAEGIRSGHAQQQTFPENDQSQFNRARAGDAGKTPSGVGELSAEQLEVLHSLGLLSPEQEADLSGRGGDTSDQPTNPWGERLIPEAEARAHLRDGTRGTADPVAGRAHVPVGAPGRAAGRAGEHLQLPDHAEGQSSPGARGDSDDGRATSRLLGVVRRLSESASDQLAGVPTATRYLDSRVGPFSGTETRARIKNPGTAQEALVVEVYGKEQIAAGLDEEPALAWTVNARTGELDVNGPNPDRGTFREFQKRGWADHARGQDGEIAVGWTALRNPDGGATLPIGQIIPMLADVHARYRALRKEDRVGLRWSRITGATGGPAGREASVFFSRARMPKHLSEAQRDALSQIRSFATPESLPKRARRVLGELRRELVQGVFDQFQPIQALDETAYMQARLSRGTDGVLESLFLHGTPFLRDGAFDVKADGQGLRGVLSELQGEHDLFLSWIAGHRAAQLKEQGREHLFSAQQIDALKALNRGKMPDGSDRAAAYRKALNGYNRYQKAVLDIGEQAGLFSAKNRATWESEFYIPFFRDFDAEQQNEPSPYREPGTQKVIQQLEGGRQPLGDLLSNVLENHSRILTASMRNMAADKALRAAEQAGMAAKVDTGSKDTHRVMRQGAPVHYQVADAPLVDALTMLHFNGDTNKTVQVLGAFKRALSFGVTISPGFRIRNLLRDTISAMSVADTADVTWNPLKQLVAGGKNVVRGWKASEHGSPMFQRLLAGGGAVRFGTLNDGAQSQYARRLIATGVNPDQILDTATKLKRGVQAAFQWWQDVGDRGETVNRAVIYERAIQAGKNHLQASYEARDLIDFTAGGKWAAVRFLSQTVPFFNARLQGMYKLGRAAKGDFERFSTVTGTVALASALLYLLQHDDEEYQALPDWARDAYWCINLGGTMLFIPKPFEVGALGSVVERGTELMVAGEDYQARDFARSVTSIISDQLQMNPVPQAVRPLMEVAFNRDTFRGRPIDGMGQERLPAEDRYTARTSAAAVMAGRATNVSPQRIEHLVKGYFGWLGVQALNVADIATRPMTSLPSNPARDMTSVSNWPVAGEFLRDASSVSSKYVERFYTMQQQNEELYAAFSAARAAGDIDRAMKLADTDAVQNRTFHNAAKRQMQEVGRSIRQVTADPSLSVREKNELLTHFQAIRNQIAHQVDQITRAR